MEPCLLCASVSVETLDPTLNHQPQTHCFIKEAALRHTANAAWMAPPPLALHTRIYSLKQGDLRALGFWGSRFLVFLGFLGL